MGVDCVAGDAEGAEAGDSAGGIEGYGDSSWNGHLVKLLNERTLECDLIAKFNAKLLQKIEDLSKSEIRCHHYDLLDLREEFFEEICLNLDQYADFAYLVALHHPSNREFALADPTQYQADILQCRNIFKTAVKSAKKCVKKIGKGVKKGAKEVAGFVKDHRKEILIGAAVVAAATGAYLLVGALSSSAAAVTPSTKKREEDEDLDEPACDIPVGDPPLSDIPLNSDSPSKNDPAASDKNTALQGAVSNFLKSLGEGIHNYNPLPAAVSGLIGLVSPEAEPTSSCRIQTEGVKLPGIQIGFINGMNTSFEENNSHLAHLKKFAGDLYIEGVYNHSNGAAKDVQEIFALNYSGIAPITANLLLDNWTQFHEENRDNPHAKYLQFTHSMGTILAKDGLLKAPQEIRDRVIIVAFGPAVIIPEDLCHGSFHYASEKDLVHYGENVYALSNAAFNESERAEFLQQLIDNKQRLILLDPHEGATGMDHDFESPTFDKKIKEHIEKYLSNGKSK